MPQVEGERDRNASAAHDPNRQPIEVRKPRSVEKETAATIITIQLEEQMLNNTCLFACLLLLKLSTPKWGL